MELDFDGYPKTRPEARKARETHYYTGKPCVHGHKATRFTSTGACSECGKLASAVRGRGGGDHR
jgi:hypothetical protein